MKSEYTYSSKIHPIESQQSSFALNTALSLRIKKARSEFRWKSITLLLFATPGAIHIGLNEINKWKDGLSFVSISKWNVKLKNLKVFFFYQIGEHVKYIAINIRKEAGALYDFIQVCCTVQRTNRPPVSSLRNVYLSGEYSVWKARRTFRRL